MKRKVFEVDGPGVPGAVPLDARARAIFDYFKQYNYEVKERGEVITFVGNYQASRGQAAALVSYVFFGKRVRNVICTAEQYAGPHVRQEWTLSCADVRRRVQPPSWGRSCPSQSFAA